MMRPPFHGRRLIDAGFRCRPVRLIGSAPHQLGYPFDRTAIGYTQQFRFRGCSQHPLQTSLF